MALTHTIEITGLAELDAMLRRIPEEVAGDIMREALGAGGEVIRTAAAANVHSRSGKTAKDIRVQVQVHPEDNSGAAAIGGTVGGEDARGYILRFIEFGARGKRSGGSGWDMAGGAEDARLARKAARALRKSGNPEGAKAFRAAIKSGDVQTRHALGRWPGGIPGIGFRAAAHHPGFAGYSPLTRALASSTGQVVNVFKSVLQRRLLGITRTRVGH